MTTPAETARTYSENLAGLQPSATMAVSSLAAALRARGRDVINLGAGEPDFPTPAFIAEAAVRAIHEGRTRYTPVAGVPELRDAVVRGLERDHGVTVDASGIVVTAGAKQALFNAIFALAGPGDRVLIPEPYWTSYPEMVRLARATPVAVRGPESRGYRVGPEELDAAWDPATRVLILNSPANPTGAVYPADELEAVADWARRRDVRLISDEIYARLCYVAPRAPGLLDLPGELREGAVLVNGASKAFAMTGWRIGYSSSDPELAARIVAVQSHVTSNAATPSQYAALAALTATPEQEAELEGMVRTFHDRRDRVLELLDARLPGTPRVRPDGAFYLFFRVDRWFTPERPDSVAFCRWVLEEAEVALIPGSAFGDDRAVRLSFAASPAQLEQAFDRLARLLGG